MHKSKAQVTIQENYSQSVMLITLYLFLVIQIWNVILHILYTMNDEIFFPVNKEKH